MTVDGITKYLKPAVADESLFYISTTSIKSFYASQMKDIVFDDATECFTWTDKNNDMRYVFDYGDVNQIVLKAEDGSTQFPQM